MIKGSKAHFKEVEKHRDFSEGLILVGGLPRLKNSQKQKKFSKAISILAISSWPSTCWIPLEFSVMKFAKLIVQCLKDDMHASLPVLKYRPPFLLSLLVA